MFKILFLPCISHHLYLRNRILFHEYRDAQSNLQVYTAMEISITHKGYTDSRFSLSKSSWCIEITWIFLRVQTYRHEGGKRKIIALPS